MTVKVDTWIWGREQIIWGYDPTHKYTLKILEPKRGRDGCLSLQYHLEKSESWLVLRGRIWILAIFDDQVCTRIMGPSDGQNLEAGTIHRLAGITADAQVIEPSTPDRHAADKSLPKDVIRLHCVHGRDCAAARTKREGELVKRAIEITDEAMSLLDDGREPPEYQPELLMKLGGFRIS